MSSGYPSGLTAGAFEMLIHYFYTPVDVEGALDGFSSQYRSIKELEHVCLVELAQNEHGSWKLTERGLVLARHIVNLPLPASSWEMR